MIENRYQPREVEGRIYAAWEAAEAFRAGRPERAAAPPYCIVIPPPNVTGSLHIGHALNNTLQDILCRFERMRGQDVLWQPGMDHAGIATQAVVERQLMERQQPGSRELGREGFIKRVWEWKAESGGTIIGQLKRLGASCDWSRERFTMDEGLSRAVLKVFVALYREGLIYKDKRLVNWDPKLKTAISDLEVQQVETKGHLWHIKYPIEGSGEFIVVATTRPETMLGDVAVAVHPQNERLKHLIGRTAILPLVGRRIPIIGDEYADPEKGTGAVKITPAHDFNDFEVGRRHNLPLINVFDVEGRLDLKDNAAFLDGVPPSTELEATLALHGLDRMVARKAIVERLEAAGLLDKIEPTTHVVPHGDRSGAVVEPYLTDQWYVDAKTLAAPAIAAVRERKTVFVPPQWEATYFNWMENIQPWCISRQIWWGHQIPAWYGPDGKIFVAETEDDAVADALAHYTEIEEITAEDGHDIAADPERRARFANEYLHRDEDVLDTWFSSALWPFSTLGWPDETPELKRFYPTSVLVTGFDIIFFWVARMMMMGLHFMKEVPFHDVYIHALVRDATGAKMSKSKGNIIDPLAMIDEYGADALRFTLAAMAAQGRDIKLSAERVAGYRNFATKLWNAARFAEINGCARDPDFDPRRAKETLNRWIAHETAKTGREVTAAIEAYKFNEAASAIYRFVWNVYCDWYLELIKPVLTGPDGAAKTETRAAAAWALDEILKLLHPFMPFITEELWQVTAEHGPRRHHMLALAAWPQHDGLDDAVAEAEIGWVIDLVTAIRSVRTEMDIAPATMLPLVLVGASPQTIIRARHWSEFVQRLARVADISFADAAPQGAVQLVVRGEVAALPLKGVIDLAAERARLAKEMAKVDADIARVDAKLGNANFVARAPQDVVEEEKEKREEALARKAKIAEAVERLEGAVSDQASRSAAAPTQRDSPKRTISVFILGAGFSQPAGLPLANDLWREVRRRAEAMTGRAEKFRDDLNDYIQYIADCEGVTLRPDDVNFEKFLSYLDVEFHLGLRGKDTWSSEGNEAQIIVKTLIGQILAEKMPKSIPRLYEDFARKLKPGDTVLTFNYDLLLERSLDKIGMPYRLFPDRFTEVSQFGGTTDSDRELSEVLILKLHGSLDWFSKESYLRMETEFKRIGSPGHPYDAIFNPSNGLQVKQLVEGPRQPNDPLKEVYRVVDVERLYKDPPFFLQTPLIVPPSTSKILWFDRFKDFWWGMGSYGVLNSSLTVIGFSLAAADDYARQIIYAITRNYQKYHWGMEELNLGKKTPMLIIDYQTNDAKKMEFRNRYSFVDWSRAEVRFDGFGPETLDLIS